MQKEYFSLKVETKERSKPSWKYCLYLVSALNLKLSYGL